MRAWLIREHGGTDVLKFEEMPAPEPGPGEVRIKTISGALNHLDLWVRKGVPGHEFPLPLIPMSDVAGFVESLGPGVESLEKDQRVVLYPGVSCGHCPQCLAGDDPLCSKYGIRGESFNGGAASFVVVPEHEAVPLPDTIDWSTAGSFGLTFLTAYRMIFTRGQLQPGEWVLIHAAGSGVSSAAIQLAKLTGAKIITTAGSDEKIRRAKAFEIDHVINYKETDFAQEVRSITNGRGVDLIVDHIGADTYQGNIRSLAKGGRMVICGNTSGPIVECNLAVIFFKGLSVLGSTMGSRAEFLKCLDLVSRGLVGPVIDRKFAFDEMAEAHEYLENRRAFGKVVISIVDKS